MADIKTGRLTWKNGDNHTVCTNCDDFIKMGVNESPYNRLCKDCKKAENESEEKNWLSYLKDTYTLEERVERLEKIRFEQYGEEY